MNLLLTVVALIVAVAVWEAGKRLWVRWRNRPRGPEACALCGTTITGRQVHNVVTVPSDDLESSWGAGGTFMRSTTCARHCPGGCDRRHLRQRARIVA